jgi:hypothetical protein
LTFHKRMQKEKKIVDADKRRATMGYLELSSLLNDDLLQSEKALEKIKTATASGEPSKMDVFWELCEAKKHKVKLILSDSLETPFYLPQRKNLFDKSEEEMIREQKRIEFMTKRDLQAMLHMRKQNIDAFLPSGTKLSPRDE